MPAAFGTHACECGLPEVRNLSDGVFRCPACGAEIPPLRDMQGRLDTAMGGKGSDEERQSPTERMSVLVTRPYC